MKVAELLVEIEKCRVEYGEDFLAWDVYTEQIEEVDKNFKKGEQKWKYLKDTEGWEYFDCAGFWTKFPDKKVFTINVNY